jgi:hypothetical protein
MTQQEIIIEKLKGLPPESCEEVEHFIDFLKERRRVAAKEARAQAIAAYAAEFAGTEMDFDPALEAAGVEYLLETEGLKP